MLAKMRSGTPRARLGGVYPLGSCSRAFGGAPFADKNFILGDFLVVDGGDVKFDPNMTLKEDYDFTCSHLKAHGCVLRCQRMTLCVKHYSNAGGACSNRDKKGLEEKRNIAILNEKWPGVFRPNPKRNNEVIMRWKTKGVVAEGTVKADNKQASKGLRFHRPKFDHQPTGKAELDELWRRVQRENAKKEGVSEGVAEACGQD